MKRLRFCDFDEAVDLDDPQFITLVLESPVSMRRYCEDLFSGFGEDDPFFRLSNDGKPLYLDEHGLFLPNPFALDLNSKRNLNALAKLIKKSYFDDLSESVEIVRKTIEKAVEDIRLDFAVEIVSDFDLKTDDIFKIANIKFDDYCENAVERLCKFLSVENELQRTSILFTLHLRDYFSEEEIESIRKEIGYRGWSIIDLESRNDIPHLVGENRFVMDRDFCSF